MPLYDYTCNKCKRTEEIFVHSSEEEVPKCNCGGTLKREFPTSARIGLFPSGGVFLEHASAKGEHFETKQQMRDFAKKNDMELGALL
jgi:putative FmdB family regulatory protein